MKSQRTFANHTSRHADQCLQKSLLFTNPREKEILKNAHRTTKDNEKRSIK
jgi:hypothetical protein